MGQNTERRKDLTSYDHLTVNFKPSELLNRLNESYRTLWFGALSFEERCIGSLQCLQRNGLHITKGIALSYATEAYPPHEDKERKSKNWEMIGHLQKEVCSEEIDRVAIDAFSFYELQKTVDRIAHAVNADFIIFDITCMTKLHTMALAAMLTQQQRFHWAIAYSSPENYTGLDDVKKSLGWRDIIIAPLAETGVLFNEAHGRGVIIAGHESARLIVALLEMEPSGGVVLIADTPERPDLRRMSERLNTRITRQLTSMQSSNWVREVVQVTDTLSLRRLIGREVAIAKEHSAPVIIFPYGPKLIVFLSVAQLISEYPEASWFVYPIPSGYDVNYTEGIEKTLWLS